MKSFKTKLSEEAKEWESSSQTHVDAFNQGALFAVDEVIAMLRHEELNGGEWWVSHSHAGSDYALYIEQQVNGESE